MVHQRHPTLNNKLRLANDFEKKTFFNFEFLSKTGCFLFQLHIFLRKEKGSCLDWLDFEVISASVILFPLFSFFQSQCGRSFCTKMPLSETQLRLFVNIKILSSSNSFAYLDRLHSPSLHSSFLPFFLPFIKKEHIVTNSLMQTRPPIHSHQDILRQIFTNHQTSDSNYSSSERRWREAPQLIKILRLYFLAIL